MHLQFVLDLDGLRDTTRERAVGIAPLVPDLRRRNADQILRI